MAEKKENLKWELVNVPTQHEIGYKLGDEILSTPEFLLRLGNSIEELKNKL